jgi:NAD(P)H-dependent FMN reductase
MKQNDQAGNRLFVVGLCGSIRRGSYTRMAVQMALQGGEVVGAQTRLLDLQEDGAG